MGRLRFELRTNRLKAECSTAELATPVCGPCPPGGGSWLPLSEGITRGGGATMRQRREAGPWRRGEGSWRALWRGQTP